MMSYFFVIRFAKTRKKDLKRKKRIRKSCFSRF